MTPILYIKAKGLRGAMVWELDGDDGTLVGALDAGLK
jgi:chitinase